MRLRSNLGNNSKRGARRCGSDDSDSLNNVGGGNDLGRMGSGLSLGNSIKQGARRCESDIIDDSNNSNNAENDSDLRSDESNAVKIKF